MNLEKLKALLEEGKIPKFREAQIKRAFFKEFVSDWSEVRVLPAGLRESLRHELEWDNLALVNVYQEKRTDTSKAVFRLKDGEIIESVLIRHKDGRNTVCVSSQVGCPLGCSFCATGHLGFKRNLTSEEIVEQVIQFSRVLRKDKVKVTNVVYMGMGEPFLNYENVLISVALLNDLGLFALGSRHISISTIGIIPGIKKLAEEPLQVNLAFSLHATNDRLRDGLIPMNKKYGLRKILEALEYYIARTGRRVMVEYLMIAGINDRPEHARELIKLFSNKKLFYINLIKYHKTKDFLPSHEKTIKEFMDYLNKNGLTTTRRYSFGESILGACGQLAGERK
jgi:23S rRNA (adenine2503-C2)-methyltransferase